jgi:regulator of sirC expression with transglutaminase-like and TPR domain
MVSKMDLQNKIASLMQLIDDSSSEVRRLAWEELRNMGDAVLPYLAEAYVDIEEIEIKEQIHALSRSMVLDRFERSTSLLGDREDNAALERFLFKIAQLEYPGLDIGEYTRWLDQIANEIRIQTTVNSSKLELIQSINWYLFQVFGLKPNRDRYYDPQNNFINRVLDRKRGIPVSMSVLYMIISRRLGLELSGVALPGHFVITPNSQPGVYFIDPYNSGRLINRDECQRIVEQASIPFQSRYLRPVSTRVIISRVLRNLSYAFQNDEDDEQMNLYKKLIDKVEN